jgi:hypothetical protein
MTIIDLQDGTKLSMYDSIFEMPTNIYAEFRANELLAAGIGNIDAALNRTMTAIVDNDNEKALIEAQNTFIAVKHVEGKYDPEHVQFGWLIKAVGDSPIVSVTNEDRQKLVADLGEKHGLTHGQVVGYLETVKKNLNLN